MFDTSWGSAIIPFDDRIELRGIHHSSQLPYITRTSRSRGMYRAKVVIVISCTIRAYAILLGQYNALQAFMSDFWHHTICVFLYSSQHTETYCEVFA